MDGICIEVTDSYAKKADTRVEYTGFSAEFQEGDAVGVFAVNGTTVVSENVKFTRQADGSWLPESGRKVTYNPDFEYYAYYPFTSSPYSFGTSGNADTRFAAFITDSNDKFHQDDQSTLANYMASDYMHAQGVVTGKRVVKFIMNHMKGLAVIDDSEIPNKWYYFDDDRYKYSPDLIYTGNVPYSSGNYKYYLMKPNTPTAVGGLELSAASGKYVKAKAELTGTPTYLFSTSSDQGNTYGNYSSNCPTWLAIGLQENDDITDFSISTVATKTTTISLGNGMKRFTEGDNVLKAAAPVSDVDLSLVDNAGNPTNSMTTANCYLVHAPGTYKIPLVYGNAIKNGIGNNSYFTSNTGSNILKGFVDHNGTKINSPFITYTYEVDDAKLIWEDVKGVISSVGIDGDFLTFEVDRSKIASGNAVVAATSHGTIVWSWHIWLTTETLSDITTINTGAHTYGIAPVNVGQINGMFQTGTLYAGSKCKIRATANNLTLEFTVTQPDYLNVSDTYYDLFPSFQWGRKDAIIPVCGAYNSLGEYFNKYSTSLGNYIICNIGGTIKNPDKMTYANNSLSAMGQYLNLWNLDLNRYSDGTASGSNGVVTTATVKTIYDPCPPGFCVPTDNLFLYMKNSGSDNDWDSSRSGKTWNSYKYSSTTSGSDIYFPASPHFFSSNGFLTSSPFGYWSSSSTGSSTSGYSNARVLGITSSNWSFTYASRICALAIRPVVEE